MMQIIIYRDGVWLLEMITSSYETCWTSVNTCYVGVQQ